MGVISYQIAIINLLKNIGLKLDFILCHIMGEIATAFESGLQSEKETIGVALDRTLIASMINLQKMLKSATARNHLEQSKIRHSQSFIISPTSKEHFSEVLLPTFQY